MKYVRTIDGIYRVLQYGSVKKHYVVIAVGLGHKVIDTSEIIKQADTIPELCDELIIKNPNNDGDFFRKVFVYQSAWKNILNEKHAKFCTNRVIYEHVVEIFGAIWVIDSNGVPTLKPVAKMNEEGELELL